MPLSFNIHFHNKMTAIEGERRTGMMNLVAESETILNFALKTLFFIFASKGLFVSQRKKTKQKSPSAILSLSTHIVNNQHFPIISCFCLCCLRFLHTHVVLAVVGNGYSEAMYWKMFSFLFLLLFLPDVCCPLVVLLPSLLNTTLLLIYALAKPCFAVVV